MINQKVVMKKKVYVNNQKNNAFNFLNKQKSFNKKIQFNKKKQIIQKKVLNFRENYLIYRLRNIKIIE